jgi:hypothetical protein
MSKRIEKDGKFYRMRRGKLVEIPPEWVGRVFHGCSSQKCSHCKYLKANKAQERKREKIAQTRDLCQQVAEYHGG